MGLGPQVDHFRIAVIAKEQGLLAVGDEDERSVRNGH
jgi:hypothetical protein